MRPSIIIVILSILASTPACNYNKVEKLPIFGRKQVNLEQQNGKADTTYHTIADFAFVDQDSTLVSNQTLADQIYVSDFFFTSCPDICPAMATQMLRVYQQYEQNPEVKLVSYTIDPKHDSVPVLKDYALKLGVSSKKWHFLTGKKEDIYSLGQTSYLLSMSENLSVPGGFLHSGAFVLIDKSRRIRGIYDGTDAQEVDKLISDIKILLHEYQP